MEVLSSLTKKVDVYQMRLEASKDPAVIDQSRRSIAELKKEMKPLQTTQHHELVKKHFILKAIRQALNHYTGRNFYEIFEHLLASKDKQVQKFALNILERYQDTSNETRTDPVAPHGYVSHEIWKTLLDSKNPKVKKLLARSSHKPVDLRSKKTADSTFKTSVVIPSSTECMIKEIELESPSVWAEETYKAIFHRCQ